MNEPICCTWDAVEEPSACKGNHVGYVHASSFEEVQSAIEGGDAAVVDVDGDVVVELHHLRDRPVWQYTWVRQGLTPERDEATAALPATFLVRQPPPTEEEMVEVYRSLGVNPPEGK